MRGWRDGKKASKVDKDERGGMFMFVCSFSRGYMQDALGEYFREASLAKWRNGSCDNVRRAGGGGKLCDGSILFLDWIFNLCALLAGGLVDACLLSCIPSLLYGHL